MTSIAACPCPARISLGNGHGSGVRTNRLNHAMAIEGTTQRTALNQGRTETVRVGDDLAILEVAPAAPRPPTQLQVH